MGLFAAAKVVDRAVNGHREAEAGVIGDGENGVEEGDMDTEQDEEIQAQGVDIWVTSE